MEQFRNPVQTCRDRYTIGDRAVIGAGAVVTHDVPVGAWAAGNPAYIIRLEAAK